MSDHTQSCTVSRRETLRLLGLGAATTLLPAFATRAIAAPSDATSQAESPQGAGFYRFKVGEFECAVLADGGFPGRPNDLFPSVGDDELAEALDKTFITPGYFPMSVNGLLVRTGNATVLIDTGTGAGYAPSTGKLVPNLQRAGVSPDEVTHVILSHAHGDHIGGLLKQDGSPQFTKARVIISEAEHAFWTGASPQFPANTQLKPEMQQGMVAGAKKVLEAVKGQLDLKKPGDTVANTFTLVDAAGHTPGMVAVKIGSGDSSLLYIADTLHVLPIQLMHPDWKLLFDTDPDAAIRTRKRFLDQIASDRTLVVGPHLPFPTLGHIAKDGNSGYRWFPKVWEW